MIGTMTVVEYGCLMVGVWSAAGWPWPGSWAGEKILLDGVIAGQMVMGMHCPKVQKEIYNQLRAPTKLWQSAKNWSLHLGHGPKFVTL